MEKFEVGKKYNMFSACSQDCIWTFEVIKRTAKTVTVVEVSGAEKSKTLRINAGASEMRGAETVYPLGKYSMAPVLSADRIA